MPVPEGWSEAPPDHQRATLEDAGTMRCAPVGVQALAEAHRAG